MKKYIIGLMAVTSLASCSNEEIWTTSTDGQSVINAAFEGKPQPRVGFTDTTPAVFFWNADDKISVHTTNTSNPFVVYSLASGAGTGSAQFQGTLVGKATTTSVCALYPSNSRHKYNEGGLTYHMADSYTYANADGQFGLLNGGVSNSTNAPMLAKIATQGSMDLSFKHLGGVFCFQIAKIPADATKFVFTANTKITGDFTVNLSEDTPSISTISEATQTSTTDEGKTVTINFTAGTEKRVFYIPVPTGTYMGFGWEIKNANDKVLASFQSDASNTINRATLLKMPLLTCSTVTGGITSSVQNVSDLNQLLQTGDSAETLPTSVTVTTAKDIDTAIEIPAAYTSSSTEGDTPNVLNLTFNEVPTAATGGDGAIEIKESLGSSTTTPAESKASIEIAIPKVKSSDQESAPSFNITLPAATVTLAAAEEATTYNKIVATTATNTLIVDKGVTVKELIVKGGNVRAKTGSTITQITRDQTNSATVIIYKEGGAELPDLSDNNVFTVVDVAVAEMEEVARNGGTYTLTTDLTGDFTISATNEVIINLNGHKITNKSGDTFTVNYGSSLTINGNGTVDNVSHGKACVYNNGTVILNGGTYTRSKENGQNSESSGGNSYYNILNHGEMTINPNVEISQNGHYSSMIANGYYDYTNTNPRNGYVSGTNHQNPSLIINGGTFAGGLNTIKNDDGAKLVINDGTFINMSQATVQNHHVTEIKGGTFNTTGSARYVVDNEGHNGAPNDLGQMTISGGILNGKVYVVGKGASLAVTGGTFSDPSALLYLSGNANVKIRLNEDVTCDGFKTKSGQSVELDLDNHELTLAEPTVGSAGTATNSCQLLEGSTVTMKNGTLKSDNDKIMIQNYCHLTLDAMTVNGPNALYVLSNNCGNIVINNTTINAKSGAKAFDLCGYSTYTAGVKVTVKGTSIINGDVELSKSAGNTEPMELNIEGGTFNGNLVVNSSITDASSIINVTGTPSFTGTGWESYKK